MRIIKYIRYSLVLLFSGVALAQNKSVIPQEILSYEEYIGYVKKHHPIIKQANLILSNGEAKLLKSRGGFDPKVEVDYSAKDFKKTDYYDIFKPILSG